MSQMKVVLIDNEVLPPTKTDEMSILVETSSDVDLREKLLRLVQNIFFRILTLLLIIIDCSLLIADFSYDHKSQSEQDIYNGFALFFSIIFFVEVFIRLYAIRVNIFFNDFLNCIDFMVIIISLIVTIIFVSYPGNIFLKTIKFGRIVRAVILLRILRIIFTEPRNIQKGVRRVVSENKRRYQSDGFDLDLTYVTPRVIGMSFPSTGTWALYRNYIGDVARFFNHKHGIGHYRIYNLCSEKAYDVNFFHGHVRRFPIDDHNVPTLHQMLDFVNDVKEWLEADDRNVIAVHCKGGKGRTGTMICAWLIFNGHFSDSKDVLDYFGDRRTDTSVGKKYQGVETPSQARYIDYFRKVINDLNGKIPEKQYLKLSNIRIDGINNVGNGNGSDLSCSLLIDRRENFDFNLFNETNCSVFHNIDEDSLLITPINCPLLHGDVRLKFYCSSKRVPKAYENCAFYFWFNTSFVDLETKSYVIARNDLDNPHKSKTWSIYKEKFKITLNFTFN